MGSFCFSSQWTTQPWHNPPWHNPACFVDCTEFLFLIFFVFNMHYPDELDLVFRLWEIITAVSHTNNSRIVSDFLVSISWMLLLSSLAARLKMSAITTWLLCGTKLLLKRIVWNNGMYSTVHPKCVTICVTIGKVFWHVCSSKTQLLPMAYGPSSGEIQVEYLKSQADVLNSEKRESDPLTNDKDYIAVDIEDDDTYIAPWSGSVRYVTLHLINNYSVKCDSNTHHTLRAIITPLVVTCQWFTDLSVTAVMLDGVTLKCIPVKN